MATQSQTPTPPPTPSTPLPPPPIIHFLLTNISKATNITNLLRTTLLFPMLTRIYIVGQPTFLHPKPSKTHDPSTLSSCAIVGNDKPLSEEIKAMLNNDGTHTCVLDFTHKTFAAFREWLEQRNDHVFSGALENERPARVLGVEIVKDEDENDKPLLRRRKCRSLNDSDCFDASYPYPIIQTTNVPAASVEGEIIILQLGNEGSGMNAVQLEICESFVYINQFGKGTASLNVNVAFGVVVERMANWFRDKVEVFEKEGKVREEMRVRGALAEPAKVKSNKTPSKLKGGFFNKPTSSSAKVKRNKPKETPLPPPKPTKPFASLNYLMMWVKMECPSYAIMSQTHQSKSLPFMNSLLHTFPENKGEIHTIHSGVKNDSGREFKGSVFRVVKMLTMLSYGQLREAWGKEETEGLEWLKVCFVDFPEEEEVGDLDKVDEDDNGGVTTW